MELNKHYYLQLDKSSQIISGRNEDESPMESEDVALIKDVVQRSLTSMAMFTGPNVKIKDETGFDTNTCEVTRFKTVENFGKFKIGEVIPDSKNQETALATCFKFNSFTREVGVWIKHPDYVKAQDGDIVAAKELDPVGPQY